MIQIKMTAGLFEPFKCLLPAVAQLILLSYILESVQNRGLGLEGRKEIAKSKLRLNHKEIKDQPG